jgi:hypothetical protein
LLVRYRRADTKKVTTEEKSMIDWNPLKVLNPIYFYEKIKTELASKDPWGVGIAILVLQFILYAIGYVAGISYMLFIIAITIENYVAPKEISVPETVKKLHLEYEETRKIYEHNPKLFQSVIDSFWFRAGKIPIEDSHGNRAIIGVYRLTDGFYWVKGKTGIAGFNDGQRIFSEDKSFIKYLKSEYFAGGYSESNEIICIGNSSYEEANIEIEECRSYCRGLYLSKMLEKHMPFKKIEILAIGKSDDTKLNSDLQRSVVILGVKKVDTLINMKDALYLHLLKDNQTPFRFWDYSLCKNYDGFYDLSKNACGTLSPNQICP